MVPLVDNMAGEMSKHVSYSLEQKPALLRVFFSFYIPSVICEAVSIRRGHIMRLKQSNVSKKTLFRYL